MSITLDSTAVERLRDFLSSQQAGANMSQARAQESDSLRAMLSGADADEAAETGPLLGVSPENGEYRMTKGQRCWITVENASVLINATDEGIVVDIWPLGVEDQGPSASNYCFYNDLDSERRENTAA